jgi:putative MATE family efflux protein
MCNGPLLGKIILFSLPLMLSGVLQLFFNAADMIVVGRWAGGDALAAVGSTGSLVNLIVNVFIGLSVGVNVLVARYYGSNQEKELSDTVHTAIMVSIITGIALIFIGVFLAPRILVLMGTPDEVLPLSSLYVRIYFCGMPAMMTYNFGASILRAIGDTRRPLYYLSVAGVINVVLNLVFVIGFGLSVAGVALATTISQVVSAILVIRCLMKADGPYRFEWSKMCIKRHKLLMMIKIGVPAGVQGAIFSISNVLIQSSINSFGSIAMAGNSAAANLEGFVWTAMNTFHQAAVSFTSQNYGAMKYKRIGKILAICCMLVTIVGVVMGGGFYLINDILLGLYSDDPVAIAYGARRLLIICVPYFICGLMDTLVGAIRGMGYAIMPMIVSLLGACALRVVWIFTVFQEHRTLDVLYISYPFTWTVTALVHLICFLIIYRKLQTKT